MLEAVYDLWEGVKRTFMVVFWQYAKTTRAEKRHIEDCPRGPNSIIQWHVAGRPTNQPTKPINYFLTILPIHDFFLTKTSSQSPPYSFLFEHKNLQNLSYSIEAKSNRPPSQVVKELTNDKIRVWRW